MPGSGRSPPWITRWSCVTRRPPSSARAVVWRVICTPADASSCWTSGFPLSRLSAGLGCVERCCLLWLATTPWSARRRSNAVGCGLFAGLQLSLTELIELNGNPLAKVDGRTVVR